MSKRTSSSNSAESQNQKMLQEFIQEAAQYLVHRTNDGEIGVLAIERKCETEFYAKCLHIRHLLDKAAHTEQDKISLVEAAKRVNYDPITPQSKSFGNAMWDSLLHTIAQLSPTQLPLSQKPFDYNLLMQLWVKDGRSLTTQYKFAPNKPELSPIHFACSVHNIPFIKALKDNGADITDAHLLFKQIIVTIIAQDSSPSQLSANNINYHSLLKEWVDAKLPTNITVNQTDPLDITNKLGLYAASAILKNDKRPLDELQKLQKIYQDSIKMREKQLQDLILTHSEAQKILKEKHDAIKEYHKYRTNYDKQMVAQFLDKEVSDIDIHLLFTMSDLVQKKKISHLVFEAFLDREAKILPKIHEKLNKNGHSAFSEMVKYGSDNEHVNVDIMSMILRGYGGLKYLDRGTTAMNRAIQFNNKELFDKILQKFRLDEFKNPTNVYKIGNKSLILTPILEAILTDRVEMFGELIKYAIDRNISSIITDCNDNHVMEYIRICGGENRSEFLKIALSSGLQSDALEFSKVLVEALKYTDLSFAQNLINNGVDINAHDKYVLKSLQTDHVEQSIIDSAITYGATHIIEYDKVEYQILGSITNDSE